MLSYRCAGRCDVFGFRPTARVLTVISLGERVPTQNYFSVEGKFLDEISTPLGSVPGLLHCPSKAWVIQRGIVRCPSPFQGRSTAFQLGHTPFEEQLYLFYDPTESGDLIQELAFLPEGYVVGEKFFY